MFDYYSRHILVLASDRIGLEEREEMKREFGGCGEERSVGRKDGQWAGRHLRRGRHERPPRAARGCWWSARASGRGRRRAPPFRAPSPSASPASPSASRTSTTSSAAAGAASAPIEAKPNAALPVKTWLHRATARAFILTKIDCKYLFEALGGLRAVQHRYLLVVGRRVRLRAAARRVRAAGVVGHAVVGPAAGERECVASDARHRPPRDAAQIARRVLQEGRRGVSLLFCSNFKKYTFLYWKLL